MNELLVVGFEFSHRASPLFLVAEAPHPERVAVRFRGYGRDDPPHHGPPAEAKRMQPQLREERLVER